jgi:hypothetical protein
MIADALIAVAIAALLAALVAPLADASTTVRGRFAIASAAASTLSIIARFA